ncbi:glycosyltransferase, partial [bacterium]|nr:glycosyltransferase [candidate division CSSED10-310 bacterium]
PRMRREVSGGRLPEDRIVVSFDGVDTGLFDPGRFTEADKEDVYGEIGFRDNIIMFHGVIDPYHGSGLLTEVIQRTIAASPANFLIIACGKGFEQMRREFRSERVKFMDFVPYDQVARYINAAHVGMIPYKPTFTLNQVFTLKFLEYASMGLPTVLFRLKSVEEIFGCHGFTLFSDSPAHFSENLVKALHIAKSEAAVRLIQDEFSWDAVTTRMVSAMEQLTAGGGCRR